MSFKLLGFFPSEPQNPSKRDPKTGKFTSSKQAQTGNTSTGVSVDLQNVGSSKAISFRVPVSFYNQIMKIALDNKVQFSDACRSAMAEFIEKYSK